MSVTCMLKRMAQNRTARNGVFAVLCLVCLMLTSAAHAHPMGNFAICHYARLQADPNDVRVRYIIDMAEIPTLTEKETLKETPGQDGVDSPAAQAAYLAARAAQLVSGVTLTINGTPIPLMLTGSSLRFSPGAGGLETLKVTLDWLAPTQPGPRTVTWDDHNYPSRTGWKEVVAIGGAGVALQDSSVSGIDRSRGLSIYPRDIIPPQDTDAHFTAVPGTGAAALTAPLAARDSNPQATRDATPRDPFTQAIARRELTPAVMLLGLLLAFVFGAFHALSPGHGKAMVAAYLVGARGTSRHAVLLGVIVTVTHTLGVFALGMVTLFASRYVVPEHLYPVLSAVSGLAVFGVGAWLLVSRLRGASAGQGHTHTHDHSPTHDHDHAPDEIHLHDEHTHSHDEGHTHSHGFGSHTHSVPDGPITLRSLLALGISGGIVPCPSALVVLLSAVALHRIAYGMVLITAFSLGLASVLIVIGMLVVSTRHWFERFPASDRLLRRLPLASAAAITLLGVLLVIRAATQGV